MEQLKNEIYSWFDNEYSKSLEAKSVKDMQERIETNLARIDFDRQREYCKEKNIDFDTFKKEQIEKIETENLNIKNIHNLVDSYKNHIDGVFNRIKYYSDEKTFNYFVEKRERELNQSHKSILLPIFDKFLETLQNLSIENLTNTKVGKKKRPKKVLFDYVINIKDKEGFIKELSKTFNTEIGKPIKAIIDILQLENIFIIDTGQYKNFINELGNGFNRYLGSYPSIQNVKNRDSVVEATIKTKLKPIIEKYKITTTNI